MYHVIQCITGILLCMSICLDPSSVQGQCRDVSSEDQRAVVIGQQVCFQCLLSGSNFTWTFQGTDIFPVGTQGFANGTLVIDSVAEVHLDPAFLQCQADGGPLSDVYRLVEACKLHVCMLSMSVITTHWRVLLTPAHSSQHSWILCVCACVCACMCVCACVHTCACVVCCKIANTALQLCCVCILHYFECCYQ